MSVKFCPLLSSSDHLVLCKKDCAFYNEDWHQCSLWVIGHELTTIYAILDNWPKG